MKEFTEFLKEQQELISESKNQVGFSQGGKSSFMGTGVGEPSKTLRHTATMQQSPLFKNIIVKGNMYNFNQMLNQLPDLWTDMISSDEKERLDDVVANMADGPEKDKLMDRMSELVKMGDGDVQRNTARELINDLKKVSFLQQNPQTEYKEYGRYNDAYDTIGNRTRRF